MKEKIFCFAEYEIFLLVTSKRSSWDQGCRKGEGGKFFTCGTHYLQGSSIPRQGRCQFFLLVQFYFLCLYLDFLLRVRFSPPASGHVSTCHSFWLRGVAASHAKSSVSRKMCQSPYLETQDSYVRDVPGTGVVLPPPADMNLSSIQLIRVCWLLTKRRTRSSPCLAKLQLSCSQMSFYWKCSLSRTI